MKKILAILIVITITTLFACSTKEEKKENEVNIEAPQLLAATDPSIIDSWYKAQGSGNFLIDKPQADIYREIFEKKIRKNLGIINDKISQAVWFDTASIKLLMECIKDPKLKIDGVRMYLMAYDKKGCAEGQYKDNQLSLVLVPTNRGDTIVRAGKQVYKHVDNWDVLKFAREKLMMLAGGINHGQLCPDICN